MKKYAIELAWLAGIFVSAYLLVMLYVGNATLDIKYHDTYTFYGGFISFALISPIFLVLTILVYFIRSILQKFRQPLTNGILLVINGFASYIVVALAMLFYSAKSNAANQPLSALTEKSEGLTTAFYSFLIASILLLALEVFVGYRMWWRFRRARSITHNV
ncbi:MAG: hypothetical protein REI78_03060 [Pedobacter sp.]|nr:hypothetical protein [Pedobacter sp.]MDQ8051972.1 hypothetical protein [Pedobacter sp.]